MGQLLLLLTMLVVMESSFSNHLVNATFDFDSLRAHVVLRVSKGGGPPTGDCVEEAEEMMLPGPEASRRLLAGGGRYISYDALRKNNVPCGRHGSSYYNCGSRQRINPYTRGCTKISRCSRNTR